MAKKTWTYENNVTSLLSSLIDVNEVLRAGNVLHKLESATYIPAWSHFYGRHPRTRRTLWFMPIGTYTMVGGIVCAYVVYEGCGEDLVLVSIELHEA